MPAGRLRRPAIAAMSIATGAWWVVVRCIKSGGAEWCTPVEYGEGASASPAAAMVVLSERGKVRRSTGCRCECRCERRAVVETCGVMMSRSGRAQAAGKPGRLRGGVRSAGTGWGASQKEGVGDGLNG
jgi:hypothetical protein